MTAHTRNGVRMSKVEAEAVDAAAAALDAAGITYAVERGGKHLCVAVGGHKIVVAGSPRTDNHKNWARQRARALIRKITTTSEERALSEGRGQ